MNAIYTRQSVDRADSISIESQIEFCKYEMRGEACKVYTDRGYSGKNTARPAFAEMMNDRAREIGCKQTQFVTANGLDAEGHYTTAEELARITYEALKNEEFIKITNIKTGLCRLKRIIPNSFFSLLQISDNRKYHA